MYTFADVLPDQYELSRHAAERHALLTAVQEQWALDRQPRRRRRVIEAVRQPIAQQR